MGLLKKQPASSFSVLNYDVLEKCPDSKFEEDRGYKYAYYSFDTNYSTLISLINQCKVIFVRRIIETMAFKTYNVSLLRSNRIFGTKPETKIKIDEVSNNWMTLKNYHNVAWFYIREQEELVK